MVKHSAAARNGLANWLAGQFGSVGRINIYTGSAPASPDSGMTGTLLATLVMGSPAFGSASAGVVTANGITGDLSADATGTAGYALVYRTGDTAPGSAAGSSDIRLLLTVSATGGGGELQFNTVSFVAGNVVSVTAFTYAASV